MKKSILTLATITTLVCTAVSTQVLAHKAGDIIVRAGLTNVNPDDASSNLFVDGGDLGLGITIEDNSQLGINVAYFITDNINVELLAATPFKHDVNFGVEDPLGTGDLLGSVKHLPPTLTVNYYFLDSASKFQPYIGAGLNYTLIFDEEFTSANDAAGLTDLSLDNSFGFSAQIGADIKLPDNWHLNVSYRYIDIDTEASFKLGDADGYISQIQIDPGVYTLSLGYTF